MFFLKLKDIRVVVAVDAMVDVWPVCQFGLQRFVDRGTAVVASRGYSHGSVTPVDPSVN